MHVMAYSQKGEWRDIYMGCSEGDRMKVSRNRAYWAYSVRKPMKRMKIIVCTGRMVYMGG